MGRTRGKKKRMGGDKTGKRRPVFFNSREKPHLEPRDWSGVTLEEVRKDFYQEHPKVKARDEASVMQYMKENRISVRGYNSPRPIESFDELCFPDCIMDAIKAQNFVKPTPIQSQAMPVALSGRNMVGIADTGSGKTLAFILPAITHVLGNNHPRNIGEPEVVVLAPTRELAQQIHQVVVGLGPGINVKSECFYGGSIRADQATLTEKVFEICIATPGRMVDFLKAGYVRLHRCAFFVLDEADRMLDMGFAPQIKSVIGQSRPDRQMLMFSATWPPEIRQLAESYLKDYILVNIGSLQISANHNITQKVEFCEFEEKPKKIVKIMKEVMEEEENKTLIFVNSKVHVDVLTLQFRMNGWGAMGLHGSKKQTEREKVFHDFKTGKISILIATDVAARGLDVDDIKYIVNYDYPFSSEDYVHRIGRTARCDRKGTAITLFSQKDRDKAKDLILVLEEAGQPVPPYLHNLSRMRPCKKKEKKVIVPGTSLKKKEIKRFLKQRNINSVPLGSETGDKLPDLNEMIGSSLSKAAPANPNTKRNKRKAENKVEVVESQPSSSKKAKTDLHSDSLSTNPSSKLTDAHYSGREVGNNFEVPSDNTRMSVDVKRGNNVYPTDHRNTNMPMDSKNYETSMGSRGSGPFARNDDAYGRRDNVYSADYRNPSMPMNSGDYETSMGLRGSGPSARNDDAYGRRDNVYSADYRNTSMPMNSRNYEAPMDSRGSGYSANAGKPDDSYGRRESNTYSTDYRNTSISGNSINYETSMGFRGSGPSSNAGKYEDSNSRRGNDVYSTDYRNTSMSMNSRDCETSMGPRGSGSSIRNDDTYGRRENNVYSADYRDTSMPVDSRGSGYPANAGKHDDSYGRRENNAYSTDYRNASMSVNSRNCETSMGPRSSGPSVNPGGTRMHTNPRNVESSFSARNQGGISSDRRQGDAGWDGAPGWQNPTYNNFTSHQASNWGPSRNNCSTNRTDLNHYPGQNWSGRSGYNQY